MLNRKKQSQKNQKRQASLNLKSVLLCISGSIAAYRSCDLTRELKRRGAKVTCLMTESAQKFVTPLTFRALSGNPVYTNPFREDVDWNVIHTSLADHTDLILIAPATADLIARLACGLADDLVTSVVLASRAKVLVVPVMNDNMYSHPTTQENIKKLTRIGYRMMKPIEGDLVCGRVGVGHIPQNEAILEVAESLLTHQIKP
jgi:phosphopantothenoylcysteine synthetase/decarboxylase